ncbi:hypothetical protein BHU72_05675 [Desulfuribacillus stibiiarsenatis]|uniref:Uncharacterized protein n=1 Tax=Desulfuribacillus stibiiarsenatis TaxID=1390249 RepID=A0A1E5L557_9FIRM|nr:hypothetical protein [Desulfuribacillus stibiiarsenatis]OEH85099.1 hypothetical protein BHU72_05675 [Desulfuribacillus stibiiarsenatis]
MGSDAGQIKGIIAYITTDKNRHLSGAPLCLLANDETELKDIALSISRGFFADIIYLPTGDCLVIKK